MLGDSEPADRVWIYKEDVHPTGGIPRTISFTDVSIKPLGYPELRAARLDRPIRVQLEMFNGRIVETNVGGMDTSQYAKFTMPLDSPFRSKAISLMPGGWLPSGLAAYRSRTVILLDRNVVTEIVSRFEGGAGKGREPDFIDVFADEPVRLNPLLYAMEGNIQRRPGPELVADQLVEVINKLAKALPKARIQVGPDSLKGILGLIQDTEAGMAQRAAFLLRLASLLKNPVSARLRDRRWRDVLDAAREEGVPLNHLVVLAALSAVAVPGGLSPAKQILKFNEKYDASWAYNALNDLRSLDILAHLYATYPDEIVHLCTADKNLALFWTGIGASNFVRNGQGVTFNVRPVDALFPGETLQMWATDTVN